MATDAEFDAVTNELAAARLELGLTKRLSVADGTAAPCRPERLDAAMGLVRAQVDARVAAGVSLSEEVLGEVLDAVRTAAPEFFAVPASGFVANPALPTPPMHRGVAPVPVPYRTVAEGQSAYTVTSREDADAELVRSQLERVRARHRPAFGPEAS